LSFVACPGRHRCSSLPPILIYSFCAIKLGSFADENRFQTGARTWTHRTLALTQTAQEFDCVRNLIRDSVDEWQNLITRGSVLAKGTLRDFGHVNVRDTIYVFE